MPDSIVPQTDRFGIPQEALQALLGSAQKTLHGLELAQSQGSGDPDLPRLIGQYRQKVRELSERIAEAGGQP